MDVKPQGSRPDQAGSPEQVRSESPDRISHSHLLVSCQETVDDDERTITKATSTASSELRGQDLFPAEPFMTLQLRSEHACCGVLHSWCDPSQNSFLQPEVFKNTPFSWKCHFASVPGCQGRSLWLLRRLSLSSCHGRACAELCSCGIWDQIPALDEWVPLPSATHILMPHSGTC